MYILHNIWFLFKYALPICKKYKFKLVLNDFRYHFMRWSSGSCDVDNKRVFAPITCNEFIPTFMHEIGHVVYDSNNKEASRRYMGIVSGRTTSVSANYYRDYVLKEEALASLFAIRWLRKKSLLKPQYISMLYKALRSYMRPFRTYGAVYPQQFADVDSHIVSKVFKCNYYELTKRC